LFERRCSLGGLPGDRLLGFQNVQADHALFGVDQGKADETKRHQTFEQAAEVGEEGGELAMGDDGFGYFEKRLVAFPGGVRIGRCAVDGIRRRAGFSHRTTSRHTANSRKSPGLTV
jgi:hypothetical protein